MRIVTVLKLIAAGIAAVFSATFYVLFRQAREERDQAIREKEQAEQEKNTAQAIQEITEKQMEERHENDELYKKAVFSDGDASFSASVDLMRDLREKSRNRNNNS